MAESLLNLQTAEGSPTSAGTQTATDLLLPPISMADRLKHFVEEVYDTSPESHISRLMKVLLGEAGAGGLRKRLLVARIQQTLQGSHFFDLDKFYGALFGMRRLTAEKLSVNPYGTATVDEWQEAHGSDASYRSRIHQLGRALSYGPTPTGIELAAEAVLSVDCDVYEEYTQADAGYRTYEEIESQFPLYSDLEGVTYAELEGGGLAELESNRRVFTVRPKRPISLEEAYDLGRVLERLKPVDSMVRIEVEGVGLHLPAPIRGLHADSLYWEVIPRVSAHSTGTLDPYLAASGSPTEQPRPPFSDYQGEAWSYNGDVVGAVGYIQVAGLPQNSPTQRIVFFDGTYRDYEAMNAIMGKQFVQAGRVVSDAILVSQPIVRRSGDIAPTPQVYADRMPVGDLVGALKQAPFAAFKENSTQRFWCSPQRPNGDTTEEVLEIRLTGDRLVNYLTYEVSHFPHVASVQVYRAGQANSWQEIHSATVTDSLPRYVSTALDPEQGHPFHSSPGHWMRRSLRFDAVTTNRIRIVLRRHEGLSPQMRAYARREVMPGRFVEPVNLPYSLALRHIDAGFRAGSYEEALASSGSTSTDVMGSLVTFVLREENPDVQGDVGQHLSGLLASPSSQWRCEPQPVPYSVVNLHIDVRDQYGAGQVIDRFFIDPTHIGVHATLYYSNDPDPGADYEEVSWTPISRDYVLQKGYMHFPPVRATFFKMEFTNLVAEPYETFMPMIRTVRMFPAGMVMAYRERQLGMATEAMPEGMGAHLELQRDTPVRYADALALLQAEAIRTRSSPTEALYPTEPATIERLRSLTHVFGFSPWHQDLGAPRFQYVQPHVYEHIEVRHINKVAYFVGLREIRAFRVDFEADDDTQVYVDHFWDQSNIETNGWDFSPNVLLAGTPGVAVTSRSFGSRHAVRAIQFASQQTEAVQIVPDAEFVDPYLSTYEWNDPDYWQKVGDAFVSYIVTEHSVKVHRDVTPPLRAASIAHGLVRPLVEPVFAFRDYRFEDEEAVASTEGGIITPRLIPAHDVRVNAAVRVSLDTDLTSPLILQIVTGNDGTVLSEEERTGVAGEMLEWTIHHDMGVFYVPPPPPVVYVRRGIVSPVVSDPFPYDPADVVPGETYITPDDETIQVRLIQKGKSNDQWRVDNLSLFDEGIVWEFSVNGGTDWWPARGIRNNENGVLTFPVAGTALAWRARGMRPGMAINSLKLRPWYIGPKNARQSGTLKGPNVSTFDQDPPIEEDPDFITWRLPVPRWWFFANKPYSALPVEGAPNLTSYARYFARTAADDLSASIQGTWGSLAGGTWGDIEGIPWGEVGDTTGISDAAQGIVTEG